MCCTCHILYISWLAYVSRSSPPYTSAADQRRIKVCPLGAGCCWKPLWGISRRTLGSLHECLWLPAESGLVAPLTSVKNSFIEIGDPLADSLVYFFGSYEGIRIKLRLDHYYLKVLHFKHLINGLQFRMCPWDMPTMQKAWSDKVKNWSGASTLKSHGSRWGGSNWLLNGTNAIMSAR